MAATERIWSGEGPELDPLVGLDGMEQLLREMGADGRLVHLERFAARPPVYGRLQRPLPRAVAECFDTESLWSHQATAIDLVRNGRSVVIATGTGSGKSLCYQVPVAEAVASPVRAATSLLLFPTKALAQDQLRSLLAIKAPRLAAATYDGDAGQTERAWVRRSANVVLTNPEMLHHGILPHHERWARFLGRLRYVVVDELHVLRGIFGSHVAQLLRRLRRLCAHYGASPTFVFTSATLGQADRLASALCGLDVVAVTEDGSPQGERLFALWNPPVLDERGTRASANSEAAQVATALVRADRRTIVFCRSRKGTELVAADIKRRVPSALAPSVRPYRSGYLADERRDIELALFTGQLRGVVATSALELGIDVSGLDACVLTGFPGTMASMWQQAGRAGRAAAEGVTVLVAGDDQLDQWLMRHPQEVFRRAPEPAVINPSNPFVVDPHLECAAFEHPLSPLDGRFWPDDLDEAVVRLAAAERVGIRRRGRSGAVAAWIGSGWPSHGIGLRSASGAEVKIMRDDGDGERHLVGTVDVSRAAATVHPGAIYLHQGVTYQVRQLDLEQHTAWVEPADGDEYTSPRSDVTFRILHTERTRQVGGATLAIGSIEVVSQVTGYQRIDLRTRTTLGTEPLALPPSVLRTRAIWYTLDDRLIESAAVADDELPGALHALEHSAIGMLPLFTICDRWDVGGVSTALHPDTMLPTVTIYDGYPGGAGIAELAFEAADRHLAETLEVLQRCACHDGCPSCVVSPKCGNGNEPLSKAGARRLLAAIVGVADTGDADDTGDTDAGDAATAVDTTADAVDRLAPNEGVPHGAAAVVDLRDGVDSSCMVTSPDTLTPPHARRRSGTTIVLR